MRGWVHVHFLLVTSKTAIVVHWNGSVDNTVFEDLSQKRGPVRGGLYVPRLNFKPFHVAISEGSHVAVGVSSKATDIDIEKV